MLQIGYNSKGPTFSVNLMVKMKLIHTMLRRRGKFLIVSKCKAHYHFFHGFVNAYPTDSIHESKNP